MSRRSVMHTAGLLLLLTGGCGYVTLSQIPCAEDSECPAGNHCGPAGYCAPGTLTVSGETGDTSDAGSVPTPADGGGDAGSTTGPGTPVDAGMGGGAPPDAGSSTNPGQGPDAGHAIDAGSPGSFDAGSPGSLDAGSGDACTDSSDESILSESSEQSALYACAQNNLNYQGLAEPQTLDCIEATGLSTACSTCVDANTQCIVAKCLYQCAGGVTTTTCVSCTNANCTPAFNACSGL